VGSGVHDGNRSGTLIVRKDATSILDNENGVLVLIRDDKESAARRSRFARVGQQQVETLATLEVRYWPSVLCQNAYLAGTADGFSKKSGCTLRFSVLQRRADYARTGRRLVQ
jgi:hypothetical protein